MSCAKTTTKGCVFSFHLVIVLSTKRKVLRVCDTNASQQVGDIGDQVDQPVFLLASYVQLIAVTREAPILWSISQKGPTHSPMLKYDESVKLGDDTAKSDHTLTVSPLAAAASSVSGVKRWFSSPVLESDTSRRLEARRWDAPLALCCCS